MNTCLKKIAAAAFAAVVVFCAAAAFAADDAPLKWDPAVLRGTLDNGVSYYIRKNGKPEKRVEIRMVVRAGSLFETDETNGIAHFIEHMGFNGTEHFAPGELVKYFTSIGADWGPDTNAYTTMDHTQYMLTLPTDTAEPLDKGLQTMADYAGGMLFNETEVEKERGVVLEELRLGRDVQTRVFEKAIGISLDGTIYPKRLTIGKKESIEKFTREKCLGYYKKWYRPDQIGVVVVGDIDPAAVEKKVRETFSKLAAPEDKTAPPVYGAPTHKDVRAGIITDPEMPVSTTMIVFTRPPEAYRTVGDYRKSLVRELSYGIYNDRLKEITLNDKPPFKDGGAGNYWPMVGMNIVAIYAMNDMNKEKKALESLLTEVERIRRHGVLPEELEEQKMKMGEALRAAVQEKDKMESSALAREFSSQFTFGGVNPGIEESKALFDKLAGGITAADVRAEINELFAPENMTVMLVLPEFMKAKYKSEDLKAVVADVQKADVKPYARQEVKKSTDYAALKPGDVVERTEDKALGVTRVKYSNGLRAFFKSTDFQKDEIVFRGFTPGGVLREDYGTRGLSRVALASWLEGGTKDLTSVQIDRLMSGKSISLAPGFRENFSLNGKTVGKDFEEALQWMRDYMVMPGFRAEGVEKQKAVLIDDLKGQYADQDGLMRITLQTLLCPGNPMAYTPTEDDVAGVTPEMARAMFAKNVWPGNMEYTFVGNLEVDKAVALVGKYLGSIPAVSGEALPADVLKCNFPEGYTRRAIYKGMENRTGIVIVYPGPKSLDPDRAAVEVMTKVADLRMNDILREKMSGTYYAYLYAANNNLVKGRDIIVGGLATAPDKVDTMIGEAEKIFKDIAENGPTAEELKSAKEIFAKNHEEELKENGYWLGMISGSETQGMPLDADLKFKEAQQKVTAEDVKAAAGKYLLGRTRIELVALPDKPAGEAAPDAKEKK